MLHKHHHLKLEKRLVLQPRAQQEQLALPQLEQVAESQEQLLQPEQLATTAFAFHDKRLPELLFRFRARNFPDTLNGKEQQRWQDYCHGRLLGTVPGGLNRTAFEAQLLESAAKLGPANSAALRQYADALYRRWL